MNKHANLWMVVFLAAACATHDASQPPREELTPEGERARNVALARTVFGLPLDETGSGSTANFTGIKTNDYLFSRRTDSRTYFVQDIASMRDGKLYTGTDEELLQKAVGIAKQLGIPSSEIANARVLHEQRATASFDPATKSLGPARTTEGTRYAVFERRIDDIPVFSSREVMTLTDRGSIEFLELHWPQIPEATLAEAHRLRAIVKSGWNVPEERGARIEAVEAGIVHSPAAAFVMDVVPAIRVIYASLDARVGGKAAIYYDRHGKMIVPPREHESSNTICPAEKPRETQKP